MMVLSLLINAVISEIAATIDFKVTFYGARDNCPPGGDISYPKKHNKAGGVGTYQDPITFAGVKERQPPGTIYYIPFIKKYVIMQDQCEECVRQWRSSKKFHIDVWMGTDTVVPGIGLVSCQDTLTKSSTPVNTSPGSGQNADSTPLYDHNRSANQGCIVPIEKCTNAQSTQCGNLCETWKAFSCSQLASALLLTQSRFIALNKGLDCSKTIQKGKTVCMGGPCGV